MTTQMELLEQSLMSEHGWRVTHINEWHMEEVIHGTYTCNVLHITLVFTIHQDSENVIITPRTYFHEPCVTDWQSRGMVEDMLKVVISEMVKRGYTNVYATKLTGKK